MRPRTLRDYWDILYRRRIVVVVTVVTAVVSATALSVGLSPVYEATCQFYVAETAVPPDLFSPDDPTGALSRQLLLPTVAQERDRAYKGMLESAAVRDLVAAAVPEQSAQHLDSHVDISVSRTHMLRVSVRDGSADVAARTANAYARAMADFLGGTRSRQQEQSSHAMAAQLQKTQAQLEEVNNELVAFLDNAGTADVQKEIQEIIRYKASMEADLRKARIDHAAMQSRIGSAGDQQLSVTQYRVDRAALDAEIKAMTEALDGLTRRTSTLAAQQPREEELRSKVSRLSQMFNNLSRRYEETQAQLSIRSDQVVVVQEAVAPAKPKLPAPAFNAVVAAALGLLAGIYFAFFYDYVMAKRGGTNDLRRRIEVG